MTDAGEKNSRQSNPGDVVDIEAILRARMSEFSPSEQRLAVHLIENLELLPFENGSSISRAVGVSDMTVTRFIRSLGFENLRDLKNRMRSAVADKHGAVDDYTARFQVRNRRDQQLQESLKLELEAIVNAFDLTGTRQWEEATTLLAKARNVYVVGFQASKGLAMDFASRLQWARPGVAFVDNTTGTFSEIMHADPKQSVVMLIDSAAYAALSIKLAEQLSKLGTPLIIVTDRYSHWGYNHTHLVFEGHTQVKMFWDSTASLSVILNLMIDNVALKLGPKAKTNFARMSDLGLQFGEFVGGYELPRKN